MTLSSLSPDDQLPAIQELHEADVDHLRLGWWSTHESSQVATVLRQAPGLSLWMPSTSEYILVGPWRHRPEIVHIRELVAIRYPVDLTRQSISQAASAGRALFLAVEMTERRQQSFYDQAGLSILEDVISYELTGATAAPSALWPEGSTHIADLTSPHLEALIDIDWSAFPWLWRNSEAEFRDYAQQAGVELHLLRQGNHNVAYIGMTCYPGWGHIDRIAVHPDHQGRGYGRHLLQAALSRLRSLGAAKIGLSTQRRNQQSQRLYSSLGFRRQESSDYRIFGRALQPNTDLLQLVTGGEQ